MANGENQNRIMLDGSEAYTVAQPSNICKVVVTDEGTPGAKTTVIAVNGVEYAVAVTTTSESTICLPPPPGPVFSCQATTIGDGCKVRFIRSG